MPRKNPEPDDDLLRFARRNGLSVEELLAHPDNEALFERRSHTLSDKDEVALPDSTPAITLDLEAGRSHVLVYAPPERVLHLELRDADGHPLSADYTLSKLSYDETADGHEPEILYGYAHEGDLREELPASALSMTLEIEGHEDLTRVLSVGLLDPVTTPAGLVGRLCLLGFHCGQIGDVDADLVGRLVAAFQRGNRLPVTGHADMETRHALVEACGL